MQWNIVCLSLRTHRTLRLKRICPRTAYYRTAFSSWTLITLSDLNQLAVLSLWGNSGWNSVDSSEGRRRDDRKPHGNLKNFCKITWKEGASRDGKEKPEPKQSKCWRSETGVRLEDSQTWGKGCRGPGKARDDMARLGSAGRAGLLPALRPGSAISLHCNEKCSSSEPARCCLAI